MDDTGMIDGTALETADASSSPRMTTRLLHMVRVDGIEHFYWELEAALDLLAAEPDADFELITVH